ncbi:multiple inositol polyphosphate phosphatase 1-like isoform X2 [Thalassophryne amazonica]|uniref:multiple inositol polyphosphate phosphatase 1-like isoform X2 n=1 Tax=Thalassophryne amazonica TaxID=390379 RepID=UPI0014721DE3|nr:multiple inositol polyphosphate phosphatase 1-like isoform X2 [Thalassophryne amazonica]
MFNPVVFVCSVFSCSLSIYAKTDVPLISEYFGARRSYEEVNPHLLEDILSVNTSILQPKSPQCRQIHLTAIIRHGTRYPTTKSVEKMQEIHQLVLRNTSGNSSWLHEIQTLWSMWYTVDMDGKLVQKGVRDLKHLAVRLSKLFPSLISEEKLRGGLIKFITSSKHRCVNSTLAFKAGLTQLWAIEDMAKAAFDLCAYEFAIKSVSSPWCHFFDKDDAQIMEYASDLLEFWKRGYGYDINSKVSCILFHDVFSRLDKVADEDKSGQPVTEAVTVQIGHADTLLPLLTLLGFFKDSEPLTSTNYATQRERTFRLSRMLPYAANFILVLYDCGDGDLRLQPLLNEKPVTFPGMADQHASMPEYLHVRQHYRALLSGCDFETECQLFSHPSED